MNSLSFIFPDFGCKLNDRDISWFPQKGHDVKWPVSAQAALPTQTLASWENHVADTNSSTTELHSTAKDGKSEEALINNRTSKKHAGLELLSPQSLSQISVHSEPWPQMGSATGSAREADVGKLATGSLRAKLVQRPKYMELLMQLYNLIFQSFS